MRIALVAPNIPIPGSHGGSTHVTELVRALRKRHEVLPVVRRGSTESGSVAIGFGTARGLFTYLPTIAHLPLALGPVRRFAPDAIYERFSANGLGVLLGRALGVPVVSMVLDPSVARLTLRGADRLITTAPQVVPQRYHHKLIEVAWGANVEHFRPDIDGGPVRQRLGIADDEFVLGYSGAFYPWHGLETLVAAVEALRDFAREHRVRFLLVGDGQRRRATDAEIGARRLESLFIRVGRVPYADVPRYVAACDGCVAPYDPQHHRDLRAFGMFFDPLKVFEYLAAGKPTITLDSPNIRKLFRPDEHLMVVPPADPALLRAAIERLVCLDDRGRAMGEAGRRIVCERYSWDAHAAQLTGIFEELVRQRSLS